MKTELGPFLLIPVVFIVAGIGIAIAAVRSQGKTKAFRARASRATGVVTELRKRWDHSTGDSGSTLRYYPVVSFDLPDGRQVETETPGASPPPAKEGAQVNVLYDPDSPTNAVIDTRWGDGSTANGCFLAFGIAFACMGALFLAIMLFFLSLD